MEIKKRTKKSIICKIILVGDSGVGKTCIINRYLNKYTPNPHTTINTSFFSKVEIINNYKIDFQIWDTVGQEQFRSLNNLFFKNSHICIIVYDITRPESFNNIKDYWYESAITNGLEGIICCIVGNKDDLSQYEKVDRNEVKEFCDEINALLKFTSAKDNYCIDELFEELGKKFINSDFMKEYTENQADMKDNQENFNVDEINMQKIKTKDNKRCC